MTRNLSQGEAMARCSAMTAKGLLRSASLFTWLLPWNVRPCFCLRSVAKECTMLLRAIDSPEWKECKGEEHHLEIIDKACVLLETLVGVLKEEAKVQKRLEAARATHGIWKDLLTEKEVSNE